MADNEKFEVNKIIYIDDNLENPINSDSYVTKEMDNRLASIYIKADSTVQNFSMQIYLYKTDLLDSEKEKVNNAVKEYYGTFLDSMSSKGWSIMDLSNKVDPSTSVNNSSTTSNTDTTTSSNTTGTADNTTTSGTNNTSTNTTP
jgi:hypothetical protein